MVRIKLLKAKILVHWPKLAPGSESYFGEELDDDSFDLGLEGNNHVLEFLL